MSLARNLTCRSSAQTRHIGSSFLNLLSYYKPNPYNVRSDVLYAFSALPCSFINGDSLFRARFQAFTYRTRHLCKSTYFTESLSSAVSCRVFNSPQHDLRHTWRTSRSPCSCHCSVHRGLNEGQIFDPNFISVSMNTTHVIFPLLRHFAFLYRSLRERHYFRPVPVRLPRYARILIHTKPLLLCTCDGLKQPMDDGPVQPRWKFSLTPSCVAEGSRTGERGFGFCSVRFVLYLLPPLYFFQN